MKEHIYTEDVFMDSGKEIPGYDGRYKIDRNGNVWTCSATTSLKKGPWRKMKLVVGHEGYLRARLRWNSQTRWVSVHRLVLEAFIGPCPEGMEARHFPDSNPANCRLENLSWGTKTQNQYDRFGTKTDPRGEGGNLTKLSWKIVRKIRKMYSTGRSSLEEIGKHFQTAPTNVSLITRKVTWKS